MEHSIGAQLSSSAADQLRAMAAAWGVAAILPLPILAATDPTDSADVSCLYLGLANAWLVVEFHRAGGPPASPAAWHARTLAQSIAAAANVTLFIAFGVAADVQTRFPFPLMAALSVLPAIGIVPCLLRRVRRPYAAVILAGIFVLAAKLAGCVVARVVYGPDYLERGYASADWRTAKLMITLFWSLTTLLSAALLLADYRSSKRTDPAASVSNLVGSSPT